MPFLGRILNRIPEVRKFIGRLDRMDRKLDQLCEQQGTHIDGLELLPGTQYSTYALPLDYRPSLI